MQQEGQSISLSSNFQCQEDEKALYEDVFDWLRETPEDCKNDIAEFIVKIERIPNFDFLHVDIIGRDFLTTSLEGCRYSLARWMVDNWGEQLGVASIPSGGPLFEFITSLVLAIPDDPEEKAHEIFNLAITFIEKAPFCINMLQAPNIFEPGTGKTALSALCKNFAQGCTPKPWELPDFCSKFSLLIKLGGVLIRKGAKLYPPLLTKGLRAEIPEVHWAKSMPEKVRLALQLNLPMVLQALVVDYLADPFARLFFFNGTPLPQFPTNQPPRDLNEREVDCVKQLLAYFLEEAWGWPCYQPQMITSRSNPLDKPRKRKLE
jgi:hypothetical protein